MSVFNSNDFISISARGVPNERAWNTYRRLGKGMADVLRIRPVYTFDEVYLLNGAHLGMELATNTTTLRSVTVNRWRGSDFQIQSLLGTVHVGPRQELHILQADAYVPFNARVYSNGRLDIPATVRWFNTDNVINGSLGGLQHLTLIHANLTFGATARSVGVASAGEFHWSSLNILSGSHLVTTASVLYQIYTVDFVVGSGGTWLARHLSVDSSNSIMVEEGGVIDLNYQGHNSSGPGIRKLFVLESSSQIEHNVLHFIVS